MKTLKIVTEDSYLKGYDEQGILCGHLPLNNSPILEGVPLLPPMEIEDDIEKLAWELFGNDYNARARYKEGYNKAKEKYKYTEEDIEWAIVQAFLGGLERGNDFNDVKVKIIQSLSQPKIPIGFECEMELIPCPDNKQGCLVAHFGKVTTTTPEGHTQWVGKYILYN